jgi:hypothetical protein
MIQLGSGSYRRSDFANVFGPGPPRMIWFVVVATEGLWLAPTLFNQSISSVALLTFLNHIIRVALYLREEIGKYSGS